MTKFIVKRYWEVSDEVEVVASSIDVAIEKAFDMPLHTGEYVPDSMNCDKETDVQEIRECEGNCDFILSGHKGVVKYYHVSGNKVLLNTVSDYLADWGHFWYCQNAVNENIRRGFTLTEIKN